MDPDRVITVDDNVWPWFNRASFDQDKVVSLGDYQYTVYWSADQTLVLARRDLRTHAVQTMRFPGYHLSLGPRDRHRNTVLGVSPGDGRLHMSWDHHNNDLRYTKSRAGFLTSPPVSMSWSDFEPAQPLTEDAPQRVTYPRFFNGPSGDLYLIYRTGRSGSGDSVLSRYSADTATWSILTTCLFSRDGTYPLWNNSTSRNAYLHEVLFDGSGRLHITWVYREEGRSWATNHDLHYAYSDDEGMTWMNNAGQTIARPAAGDPICLDDPGIVVKHIPVYSWLMNNGGMALDAESQPHVATFHMAEPLVPDQLEHNPPEEAYDRLAIYHYWRDEGGAWHGSGPIVSPDEAGGRVRRPVIVTDTDSNVVIYWASDRGFRCHVAFARDGYQTRATFPMTGPVFASTDACKHDRRLLADRGVLSYTPEPASSGEERAFAVVDFTLDSILSEARRHTD